MRTFNGHYDGEHLNHVAFPLGGIGAGMVCLDGIGSLSHVSVHHRPDVFHRPMMFAALKIKGGGTARVLEGPVPMCKAFGHSGSGMGHSETCWGLPRFAEASFQTRFPFGHVSLRDKAMPVRVEIAGWSPFIPGHADDSSLPVCALEYRFINRTNKPVRGVFSFHARNFMQEQSGTIGEVRPLAGGFLLSAKRKSLSSADAAMSPFVVMNWKVSGSHEPITVAAWQAPSERAGWKDYANMAGPGYVPIGSQVPSNTCTSLAATTFQVTQAGRYSILLGHDGGARLFVDGREVAQELETINPALMERTRVELELTAGEHELFIIQDRAGGRGQGIWLRFGWPASRSSASEPTWPTAGYKVETTTKDPLGEFAAWTDAPGAVNDVAWYRTGGFDPLTMLWRRVESGKVEARALPDHKQSSPGGSLYVPVNIKAKGQTTIRLMLAWHVPTSAITTGQDQLASSSGNCGAGCGCSKTPATYQPWYATKFSNMDGVVRYWNAEYARLHRASTKWSDCFHDTTLPAEVVEAVAANLTILKSPTCLRQHDGRFWAWEGCCDTGGCCSGTCTHVWNYAQAMPHLFPDLERTLRETEHRESQDEKGHQMFRANLPIRPVEHNFHAAADGQLGGVVKVYREWRISGDTTWMAGLWPQVRKSLDYCISTWDPNREGLLIRPHHNTYDIEFWGPDGMCGSFYMAALKAAVEMGRELGDDVHAYAELYDHGVKEMKKRLWTGQYFFQEVRRDAVEPSEQIRSSIVEERELIDAEGPKYQYGTGCLSDGVLGDWLARVSGLGGVLDDRMIASHLDSVFKHNFQENLHDHANCQRPSYALGEEGGLLLCSWPRGGKPSLPFIYSNEVWTGIEYQAASHMIMMGRVDEGLAVVRAVRNRYDGRYRNPFNEYECGHWYARAMSSYGLIQAFSGARYDAVTRTLHLTPAVAGDFRAFLATATGYATVGVRKGKPFLKVAQGTIAIDRIDYIPAKAGAGKTATKTAKKPAKRSR
ncbi:MAG: hypothetical protein IT440_03650 [Phycisphaeraceae bacterium]|nr:hypothetical protein [Phycisphaeraceae bacterium]